ncbi:C-type lectin domain family 4 member E-like [Aulostomus maculatus]
MPETEVFYSDINFSKKKGKTSGTASSSVNSIYAQVKISKSPQSTELPVGDDASQRQAATPRGSKVVPERVALLVLGALLVAAAIVIYCLAYDNMETKKTLQRLNAGDEAMRTNGSGDACRRCEALWVKRGTKCYYFSFSSSSWGTSRRLCRDNGGDLVKINNRVEQTFLETALRGEMKHAEDKFWIGLTDSQDEGEWLWVDGSPLNPSLSFWNPNEPDNWMEEGPEGEDCVRMGEKDGAHDLKCWFDKSCEEPHRYICEKEAATLPCSCPQP